MTRKRDCLLTVLVIFACFDLAVCAFKDKLDHYKTELQDQFKKFLAETKPADLKHVYVSVVKSFADKEQTVDSLESAFGYLYSENIPRLFILKSGKPKSKESFKSQLDKSLTNLTDFLRALDGSLDESKINSLIRIHCDKITSATAKYLLAQIWISEVSSSVLPKASQIENNLTKAFEDGFDITKEKELVKITESTKKQKDEAKKQIAQKTSLKNKFKIIIDDWSDRIKQVETIISEHSQSMLNPSPFFENAIFYLIAEYEQQAALSESDNGVQKQSPAFLIQKIKLLIQVWINASQNSNTKSEVLEKFAEMAKNLLADFTDVHEQFRKAQDTSSSQNNHEFAAMEDFCLQVLNRMIGRIKDLDENAKFFETAVSLFQIKVRIFREPAEPKFLEYYNSKLKNTLELKMTEKTRHKNSNLWIWVLAHLGETPEIDQSDKKSLIKNWQSFEKILDADSHGQALADKVLRKGKVNFLAVHQDFFNFVLEKFNDLFSVYEGQKHFPLEFLISTLRNQIVKPNQNASATEKNFTEALFILLALSKGFNIAEFLERPVIGATFFSRETKKLLIEVFAGPAATPELKDQIKISVQQFRKSGGNQDKALKKVYVDYKDKSDEELFVEMITNGYDLSANSRII